MAEDSEAGTTRSGGKASPERENAPSQRRRRRTKASADDHFPGLDELEDELSSVEEEDRELRHERAELLAEMATEADSDEPDLDRVDDLRLHQRRLDRRQGELNLRRADIQRDMEDEYRRIARAPSSGRSRRRGAPHSHARAESITAAGRVGIGADPMYGAGPIARAISEHTRLGNAMLLGHLGIFSAAADALSTLSEDVYARAADRADRPTELAMTLPADLHVGMWNAANRLAATPSRAVDAFYNGYGGARSY